ncbi:cysteine--tRNA ligase [Akkermansiaceae bacterium]|nr:cysteine--tRNA ligase [Akkermansiaceae bacterium]MDB4626940.1 cysteine--tRNA ligase [Akkermansiaceae bacterium]MDB4667350.1 cysteine--tRNA ligase [Akkermansiaceae bacterium]
MGKAPPVRLFDTERREVLSLEPVDGKTYRFYCCGPTVYGPAHIGNFRTFVLQDVLRRALELGGLKTKHVRNITDVDDKTIRDSVAAGQTLEDFTAQWRDQFHADCEALNCLKPHIEPSAVKHIPEQITMIEELIENGNSYASDDGSVYFKISSYEGYGKLSRLDTRELDLGKTQNERANTDEYDKNNAADFVLWKGRRDEDGDNFWESPWGQGRPGWHLECSAMIRKYLGDTFDLHSGGVDLIFPHHDNEIAQSKCSCGGDFAKHWFHITHLRVDGAKMSKSKGNLYTLSDLAEKGHGAMEVRYVLLSGHYKKPINFTLDSLHAAQEALGKLAKVADGRSAPNYRETLKSQNYGVFSSAIAKLNEDMNTAGALGELFGNLKSIESDEDWQGFFAVLAALGLTLPELTEAVVPAEIEELAAKRWEARQAKDWAASDRLRDELAAKGWVIKDGTDGYEVVPA